MSQSRQFLTVFNDVARSGPLREIINLQEAGFAAGQIAEQTPEGQPIDLNPLYNFLLDKQNPKDLTQQTFMALLERVREVGIVVREPDEIARLSDSQRGGLLRRYNKVKVSQTGGYVKPPSRQEGKPVKAENPNKKKRAAKPNIHDAQGPSKALLLALGLVLVAGLAVAVWFQLDKPKTLEPVHVVSPRALSCDPLMGNPPSLICTMDKAAFDKLDAQTQKMRADETAKAAGAQYTRLHVQTPDGFPLRSFLY